MMPERRPPQLLFQFLVTVSSERPTPNLAKTLHAQCRSSPAQLPKLGRHAPHPGVGLQAGPRWGLEPVADHQGEFFFALPAQLHGSRHSAPMEPLRSFAESSCATSWRTVEKREARIAILPWILHRHRAYWGNAGLFNPDPPPVTADRH